MRLSLLFTASLEFLLSTLQGISNVTSLFPSELSAVATIVGLQISVLLIYLGMRISNLDASLASIRGTLQTLKPPRNTYLPLEDTQFYDQFHSILKGATSSVFISHLDTHAPTPLKKSSSESYFAGIRRIIERNPTVRFRRVERLCQEKLDWIREWETWGHGKANFSLAVLPIESDRNQPHISVQLIDHEHTFLVAVGQQLQDTPFRDAYIFGVGANQMWRRYYNTVLWSRAVVVLENGEKKVAVDDAINHTESTK